MKSNKHQIFVSHSSKDSGLIDLVKLAFGNQEIKPYFAKREIEGKNPVEKIIQAINSSIGLFALITPEVANNKDTRDWVVFEVGVAKAKGIPVFCWIDESVATEKTYPKILESITDYNKFNCLENSDCVNVAKSIVSIASELLKKWVNAKKVQKDILEITKEEYVSKGVSFDVDKTNLVKLEEKGKVLLPDVSNIANLSINNSFLNQIYKKAHRLARSRYRDAQLSSFRINVYPYSKHGRVTITFDFYSKLAMKISPFRFRDIIPIIEHSPPDIEAKNVIEKMVLSVLPWKESPNWKLFIEYVIAKIERLSQNENTRCHLFADPFGLLDLGKTNVFWTFTSYDGYNGKEHYFRWNGGKVDEHNIKQEY